MAQNVLGLLMSAAELVATTFRAAGVTEGVDAEFTEYIGGMWPRTYHS